MNIQEGKYYIARNGELVGPMRTENHHDRPPFSADGYGWYERDGRHGRDGCRATSCDLTDTVDHAAMKAVEGNQ